MAAEAGQYDTKPWRSIELYLDITPPGGGHSSSTWFLITSAVPYYTGNIGIGIRSLRAIRNGEGLRSLLTPTRNLKMDSSVGIQSSIQHFTRI